MIGRTVSTIKSSRNLAGAAPFQNFSVSKVTETGKSTLIAIAPDGKYILSVMVDNGQQSLWLRNIPTNSNTQVVPPASAFGIKEVVGLPLSHRRTTSYNL
jgi:hypothetical protein